MVPLLQFFFVCASVVSYVALFYLYMYLFPILLFLMIPAALRKRDYSNLLKISPPKTENKNSDIIHISAQNIDCGYSLEPPRRDGSNEYHNLCFRAEIRKTMYIPVNLSFTI